MGVRSGGAYKKRRRNVHQIDADLFVRLPYRPSLRDHRETRQLTHGFHRSVAVMDRGRGETTSRLFRSFLDLTLP